MLTQALITAIKERVVSPDGTTQGSAKVVSLERSFQTGCTKGSSRCDADASVEVVSRVESFVAEVVEGFSMKLVRAGACSNGNDRAVAPAVLRAKCGVVDLELRRCAD